MRKATAGLVSLPLLWVDHNQISGIPTAPSPTATLLLQLKDLAPEQVVLPVCTVPSNCPWPTAIAPPAAPTFTMHSEPHQMVSSRPSLQCLPTTKASRTWRLAARLTRLMDCLLANLHTLLRVLAILAVATTARAQHRSFRTTQPHALIFVVLSIPALGL
jgi:hypothetical protein